MTPAARVAAAIEILDQMCDGLAAEQALSRWARASRFAGSKDRAAVRDHVFDVLRNWRSDAARGGASTGRGLMIGRTRALGVDLATVFDGQGHAPEPLSDAENAAGSAPEDRGTALNLPDWLLPEWDRSLGADAETTAIALQSRAPVSLRVNTAKTTVEEAIVRLEADGVVAVPNPLCATALLVESGLRRIQLGQAYLDGLVELQDASSQAVIDDLPLAGRILDYCAGGGGKALALAARGAQVWAHDIAPQRMKDLPDRAARAGTPVHIVAPDAMADAGLFDVILVDAPCSGSGAWRRNPEGKWALTAERLQELNDLQDEILAAVLPHLTSGGTLVYATCSVLSSENEDRVAAFLERTPGFTCSRQKRFAVTAQGDGFFAAHLTRELDNATQL